MPNATKEKQNAVLVIGDWIIDENWVVSRQNLKRSSHTGDIHYLANHESVKDRIVSFCGAMEIMKLLQEYFKEKAAYNFIGLGSWNIEDNNIIKCTLCPLNYEHQFLTPFTIKSFKDVIKSNHKSKNKKGLYCNFLKNKICENQLDLRNLGDYCEDSSRISTNRVIRCYEEKIDGNPHILYRFDWILGFTEDISNSPIIPTEKNSPDHLNNIIKDYIIDAIIVEDHGYGVINDESIKRLISISKDSKPKWFIRYKGDNPSWLNILIKKNIKVDLIVTDNLVAQQEKGYRRWLYKDELGLVSLDFLSQLTGSRLRSQWVNKFSLRDYRKDNIKAKKAAVLLDDNTVIAQEGNNNFGINQSPGLKQKINIGRTTVFNASLIAQLLENYECDFVEACNKALKCAYTWSIEISKHWKKRSDEVLFEDIVKILKDKAKFVAERQSVSKRNFSNLWKNWYNSSIEKGILNDELQLWRGEGSLTGYICVAGLKRNAINNLASRVKYFSLEKNPKHALSCLVTASPGWGKSYLANKLAEYSEMEYLEFSIAKMATSKDLIDCFLTISSVQNRTNKKLLIFVDEINARIESHDVMDLLLGPLWGGTFIADGRSFRLDPAVWIFASTRDLGELTSNSKGSDFASRLNGPIIELDKLSSDTASTKLFSVARKFVNQSVSLDNKKYRSEIYGKKEAIKGLKKYFSKNTIMKTEQVYIMASLLNRMWGPIYKIKKSVIELFHDLLPINGFRSLEYFASCFEEIKKGEVLPRNVPLISNNEALKRHIIVPPNWFFETKVRYNKKQSDKFIIIKQLEND